MQLLGDLGQLQTVLDTNERVVVVFSAREWCVLCKRLHPHAVAAAERLPDILFVEVDIDDSRDIRERYGILSVPTVLAFRDGQVEGNVHGRTALQLIAELSS